jgi:hypothetical protein
MTNRKIERLLRQMTAEIPGQLDAIGYGRDTCILHTRVAVDALRSFGVRARGFTARVTVGNAEWVKDCERVGHICDDVSQWSENSWCLGIGFGADPRKERPGYDGHVIAIVNDRYGLDLTIDQASRPQRNIELGAHYWKLRPGFLTGEVPEVFTVADGSMVIYQAVPEDRGFLTVPDWLMTPKAGTVNPTPGVIEALRAAA